MFGKPSPKLPPKGGVSILSMGFGKGKAKKPEPELDVEVEEEGPDPESGSGGYLAAKEAATEEVAAALASKDASGLVEAICNLMDAHKYK